MEPWMLILLLPAGLVGYSFWKGYRSPGQLRAMAEAVAEGAPLVDVRTPGEFASGHARRARNIPLGDLRSSLDDLGDPSGPVVLYCRSGSRSVQAKQILLGAGFTRVMDLGPFRNTSKLPEVARQRSHERPAPASRNQRKRQRRRRARG